MIGIYINFNATTDLLKVESQLEALDGYEVGSSSNEEPCWLIGEYSVDGEEAPFSEEECKELQEIAEKILKDNGIEYSITVSA